VPLAQCLEQGFHLEAEIVRGPGRDEVAVDHGDLVRTSAVSASRPVARDG
jgi:hypothetical protein